MQAFLFRVRYGDTDQMGFAYYAHYLRWFEVVETRGHIDEGKIQHYQVTLKIGFTIADGDAEP